MRSFIIAGAFAAMACAAPLLDERQVTVTDVYDVYTTVWEDDVAAAATTTTKAWAWAHHPKHTKAPAAVTTTVAAPTAEAAAYTPPPAAPSPAAYTTPAAAPAPVAATPSVAAGSGAPNSYAQSVVDHHNAHRANHSAPALSWDQSLADTALTIAQSCVYAHNVNQDGGGYGQNIAAGSPADNITSVITELFYNNEAPNFASQYGQATPSEINDDAAFDSWGHFTQIVWKGTTSVGCATFSCPNGLANVGSDVAPIFTVCNYKPAGNFLGEFDTNVAEPLGEPEIHWDT